MAQKIALFEKETSNVLKKSLSDEEKSKSLNRQPTVNSEALNSFLNKQIELVVSDEDNEKTADSISSESESDDEEPPSNDVPISDKQLTISDHKVISDSPDNFVVTKELTRDKDSEAIANTAKINFESHEAGIKGSPVIVKQTDKRVSEASCDDDFESLFEQIAEDAVKSVVVHIPVYADKKPAVAIPTIQVVPVSPTVDVPETILIEEEEDKIINVIMQSEPQALDNEKEKQAVEVTKNILADEISAPESVAQSDHMKVVQTEVEKTEQPEVVAQSDHPKTVHFETPEVKQTEKQEVVQTDKNEVLETEQLETIVQPEGLDEASDDVVMQPDPEPSVKDDSALFATAISSTIILPVKSSEEIKPEIDDSNPFDDVEEEKLQNNEVHKEQKKPEPTQRPSLNPFGSCSEDEDDNQNIPVQTTRYSGTLPKPPRPPPPKTTPVKSASTNPFGSDDEEDESEKRPVPLRTPVPTPRKPLL